MINRHVGSPPPNGPRLIPKAMPVILNVNIGGAFEGELLQGAEGALTLSHWDFFNLDPLAIHTLQHALSGAKHGYDLETGAACNAFIHALGT